MRVHGLVKFGVLLTFVSNPLTASPARVPNSGVPIPKSDAAVLQEVTRENMALRKSLDSLSVEVARLQAQSTFFATSDLSKRVDDIYSRITNIYDRIWWLILEALAVIVTLLGLGIGWIVKVEKALTGLQLRFSKQKKKE